MTTAIVRSTPSASTSAMKSPSEGRSPRPTEVATAIARRSRRQSPRADRRRSPGGLQAGHSATPPAGWSTGLPHRHARPDGAIAGSSPPRGPPAVRLGRRVGARAQPSRAWRPQTVPRTQLVRCVREDSVQRRHCGSGTAELLEDRNGLGGCLVVADRLQASDSGVHDEGAVTRALPARRRCA